MSKKNVIYAFYDLAVSPISFDFIAFVIEAERARMAGKNDRVHFVVVPFEKLEGHHDNSLFETEHGEWRTSNILTPLCWMLPSCAGLSICSSRDEANDLLARSSTNVFPENYRIDAPVDRHHTGWTVIAGHLGENIQFLRAPEEALTYAQQWIDHHADGRKCIPITLREAPFKTMRNSDMTVWSDFARRINTDDFFPVLIRDIDRALDKLPAEFKGTTEFAEGAFNLELRMALYEKSHLCMFVANGPAQVCFYNKNVKFLYQVTGDWLTDKPTPFNRMGIDFDETPPFANKYQRWLWQEQNADALFAAMAQLDSDIESDRSIGAIEDNLNPLAENRISMSDLADRFYDWCGKTYFSSIQEAELSQACERHTPPNYLDDKEKLIRLANYSLAAKDIAKTIEILNMVIEKYGGTQVLNTRIGVLYDAVGDFNKAIEMYMAVLKTDPEALDIYFRLGIARKNNGQIDECVAILQNLVSAGVKNQILFIELAQIYEQLGDVFAALENYQLAEEIGSLEPQVMKRKLALQQQR